MASYVSHHANIYNSEGGGRGGRGGGQGGRGGGRGGRGGGAKSSVICYRVYFSLSYERNALIKVQCGAPGHMAKHCTAAAAPMAQRAGVVKKRRPENARRVQMRHERHMKHLAAAAAATTAAANEAPVDNAPIDDAPVDDAP